MATRAWQGLEARPSEEGQKELGVMDLEKIVLRRDMTSLKQLIAREGPDGRNCIQQVLCEP